MLLSFIIAEILIFVNSCCAAVSLSDVISAFIVGLLILPETLIFALIFPVTWVIYFCSGILEIVNSDSIVLLSESKSLIIAFPSILFSSRYKS